MFGALKTESDDWLRIDVLRFVAALGIVWHHSSEFYFLPGERFGRPHGWALFVDLFFVISGVIIAAVYSERIHGPRDAGRFFKRRIARLVPLHWLTLLIALAIWQTVRLADLPSNHVPDMSADCVINNVFLLNGIWKCGNAIELTPQSWSIGVEMVLYLLFPLLLVVRRVPGVIEAAFVVSLALFLGGALGAVPLFAGQVQRGLSAFLLGMLLFKHRERVARFGIGGDGLLLLSLAMLILAMASKAPLLLTYAVVLVVGIVAVAGDLEQRGEARWIRVLAPWGALTYGIYMWHTLIILVVMNAVADKLLHLPRLAMAAVGLATYAGILVWSYWSWIYFETPARRAIDTGTLLRRSRSAAQP